MTMHLTRPWLSAWLAACSITFSIRSCIMYTIICMALFEMLFTLIPGRWRIVCSARAKVLLPVLPVSH